MRLGLIKCQEASSGFFLSRTSPQEEGGSKSSTMTELEMAMGMIIDVFARYSGAEGNKLSLTKGELRTLLEKELPGFLEVRVQRCRAAPILPAPRGLAQRRPRRSGREMGGKRKKGWVWKAEETDSVKSQP